MVIDTASGKHLESAVLCAEFTEMATKLHLRHCRRNIIILLEDHFGRYVVIEIIDALHTDTVKHHADVFLGVGDESVTHFHKVLRKRLHQEDSLPPKNRKSSL